MPEDVKQSQIQKNKEKKIIADERANVRRQQLDQKLKIEAERLRRRQEREKLMTTYELINQNEYEISIYWGYNGNPNVKHFMYVGPYEAKEIRVIKEQHRIAIFPQLEVNDPVTNKAFKDLSLDVGNGLSPKFIFNMEMKEWGEPTIILSHPYRPVKTELDLWKECGLKSSYLLNQLIRLGGRKYENLEPILDMVDDIDIPEHTEHDKEFAGIPSVLTNIT